MHGMSLVLYGRMIGSKDRANVAEQRSASSVLLTVYHNNSNTAVLHDTGTKVIVLGMYNHIMQLWERQLKHLQGSTAIM